MKCNEGDICVDEGCPFEHSADAPADCARSIEARKWIEINQPTKEKKG